MGWGDFVFIKCPAIWYNPLGDEVVEAMRIFLTGSAGFIGARTAELLLEQGSEVIGVDNLNDAYDPRLKRWRLEQLQKYPNFKFFPVDIGEWEPTRTVFEAHLPYDAVINLAARAGVRQSVQNPWVYIHTNITGALNLLELCRLHGVNKYVLASTSSLYGNNERPFREDQPTDHPLSPYASSKKGAEVMAYTYHHLYGLDITILRYFTVYGPAGRPDMSIFRFIRWIAEGEPLQLFGDGLQERDFTYVDDIARGTIAGIKPLGYEIINLGGDRPVSLLWIIERLEELIGRKARWTHQPPHPADVRATWADITKARTLLGWEPQISLEEGLKRTVEWYFANRDWVKEVVLP